MNRLKVLVTGATGFVGEQLIAALYNKKYPFQIATRKSVEMESILSFLIPAIDQYTQWADALNSVECVVHCAARVHVMNDNTNRLKEFRDINTYGTINLAQQAANAGIKRFIFISSIKVNGESTTVGYPFKPDYISIPNDPYGLSKFEAEIELKNIAEKTGMEVVIVRPSLVYGQGVKANFAALMNLASKGIPLPFGCINQNKRSLVSVTNLVDLIITCIDHPKAANQVFLVSDDHDVSTSEMVREMAKALDKPTWQLPIPIWCYKLVGKLFDKSEVVDRLTGSLQVDISHTKETLGWKPPQTLQEGFKQTAQAFLQAKTK